jgi:predicted metalloprotease
MANAPRQSDELSDFVESVASELDTYWGGIFQQRGWTYNTPTVALEGNGPPTATSCDESGPTVEHSYCPADDTIKLDLDSSDPDSFTSDLNDGRDGVVVFTIAHEWGHHLQSIRNAYSSNTLTDELQADCLAGVFTAAYYPGRGWQAEIDDTIASVRESGSPANPERTHGTAAERAAAFNMGYNAANPPACNL